MAVLGKWGEKADRGESDTFEYFGRTVRIAPDFGEAAFIDWMEEFGSLDENDPKATIAVKALMRVCVDPEDFADFWALARANRQGTEQLLAMIAELVKAVTGRPTGLPSGSAGGQTSTLVKSVVGSSSPEAIAHGMIANGRADLANVVYLAQENLAAQQEGTAAQRLMA